MAKQSGSTFVIYAALAANVGIAIIKFGAGLITGSSAMLSEAVHSTVDSGDQGLLLYGIHLAKKPADEVHPFGRGQELYFWSFVVSMLIFGVGACASTWEGIQEIMRPEGTKDLWINYGVLFVSACFEGTSWYFATKEFGRRKRRDMSWLDAARRSKDPTILTPVFEDSAALLGLGIAFVGITLDYFLGLPIMEGIASILIGVLLGFTAWFLARESRSLLVGESVERELRDDIARRVRSDPRVVGLRRVLTMHLGPESVLLALTLDLRDTLSGSEAEQTTRELADMIRRAHPRMRHVFFEAQEREDTPAAPVLAPSHWPP